MKQILSDIQWEFFVGGVIGGVLGVAYCKSDWPPYVVLMISGVVGALWSCYCSAKRLASLYSEYEQLERNDT